MLLELLNPRIRPDGRPDWDTYFMGIAITVSARGDCRRRQVGCVIVDDEQRIIASGYNGVGAGQAGCLAGACPRGLLSNEAARASTNRITGPERCISTHAEVNAIINSKSVVAGATVYVTKKPCARCEATLRNARVLRVVYGVE